MQYVELRGWEITLSERVATYFARLKYPIYHFFSPLPLFWVLFRTSSPTNSVLALILLARPLDSQDSRELYLPPKLQFHSNL